MSQRQLNVRVSAQVDKSLTDLLTKLDKYSKSTTVIKTKVVMDDKGFTTFIDKVKSFSNTKISPTIDLSKIKEMQSYLVKVTKGDSKVNVSVKVHNKEALEKLQTAKVKLSSTPATVKVQEQGVGKVKTAINALKSILKAVVDKEHRVKLTDTGISKIKSGLQSLKSTLQNLTNREYRAKLMATGMDKIKSGVSTVATKIKSLTDRTHTVRFNSEGLQQLASGLDSVASKVLGMATRGGMSLARSIGAEAGELYDAQEGFRMQAQNLGMNDKQIHASMKALSDFGAVSKFSVAELNNLGIAMKGAGFDEEFGGFVNLTKNIANISSLAPNASSALKRVSTQIKQMTLDGKVYARDWNAIRDNIGGYSAKKIVDAFKARGIDDLPKALSEGAIKGRDFLEVINEVGQDKTLQEMAKQTTTLRSAWDNMKESMTVELVGTSFSKGALAPLIDDIVKLMNTVQQATPTIASAVENMVSKFRELIRLNLGDFNFKNFFDGLIQGLRPIGSLVGGFIKFLGAISNNGANLGKLAGYAVSLSSFWLAMRKGQAVLIAMKGAIPVLSLLAGGITKLMGALGRGGKGGGLPADGGNPLKSLNLQGLVNSLSAVTMLMGVAGSLKLLASAMKDIEALDMNEDTFRKLAGVSGVLAGGATIMAGIGKALNKFKGLKKDLATGALALTGVAVSLRVIAKVMEGLNGINFNFGNVSSELGQMFAVLIASMVIMGAIGAVLVASGGTVTLALGAGALAMIGVSLALVVVAKAMEEVAKSVEETAKVIKRIDKIKLPDFGNFLTQLGKLSALMTALSGFTIVNGIGSIIAGIVGFFGALGNMAQELYVDSIVSLANKITEIIAVADTIPDEGTLTQALDKIKRMTTFLDRLSSVAEPKGWDLINIFDNIGSALANMTKGWELSTFQTNIKKITDIVKAIQDADIPDDVSGLISKVRNIKRIGEQLSEISRELSGGVFASLGGKWSAGNQTKEFDSILKTVKKIANFAKDFEGIETPNVASIKNKLNKIKELMEYLKTVFNEQSSWFDFNWSASTSAGNKQKEVEALTKSLSQIISSVKKLQDLEIDDSIVKSIQDKMKNIKEVFEEIQKALNDENFEIPDSFGDKLGSLDTLIESINSINDKLMGIETTDVTGIVESIKNNLDEVKKLAEHEIFTKGIVTDDLGDTATKLDTFVGDVKKIGTSLQKISEIGDIADIDGKIEQITNALTKLDNDELHTAILKFKQRTDPADAIGKIKTLVTGLKEIATTLNELPAISAPVIEARIGYIKSALEALADDALKQAIDKVAKLESNASSVQMVVNDVKTIATSLLEFPDLADAEVPRKVTDIGLALVAIQQLEEPITAIAGIADQFPTVIQAVGDLKQVAQSLLEFPDITQSTVEDSIAKIGSVVENITMGALGQSLGNIQYITGQLQFVNDAVEKLVAIAELINTFPVVNTEPIMQAITDIQEILTQLGTLTDTDTVIGNITNVMTKLEELKTALTNLTTTASTEGKSAGTNYAQGWITGLGSKIKDKVEEQMNAIVALDWTGSGNTSGSNLASGFEAGVGNKLADKANQQRQAIEALDWYGTGARISAQLTNGFDVSGILAKIQQIQSAINSLQGKTIDVVINQTTVERTVKRQHGGIIPEYHSTGGVVGRGWRQSGTDTVPAMLTAGEYVLKRSVSSALGTQFLNALNNMNLASALRHLQNKVGNTVTNNNYTITQNVDNKASFMNGLNDLKGVVRP